MSRKGSKSVSEFLIIITYTYLGLDFIRLPATEVGNSIVMLDKTKYFQRQKLRMRNSKVSKSDQKS